LPTRLRDSRRFLFAACVHRTFTFLPPFTPWELPHFSVLMAALTSAGRTTTAARSVPADLLHLHVSSFPDLLSPTTPAGSLRASVISRVGCRARARQTSPATSRLVADTVAVSCSFVIMVDLVLIRCFPPRLAATQLLRVLASTTAAGGRGIPPRKRTLLSSALVRICNPAAGERPGKTECNSVLRVTSGSL